MARGNDQIEEIRAQLTRDQVGSLQGIAEVSGISERTVQRYLKSLQAMTSFTHRRKFVALPNTPRFDENGIWFYRKVGFSKHGTGIDTILWLIEQSEAGLSRMELETILRTGLSKQIQILVQRGAVHRAKIGNKYLYIPEGAARNKKKKLKLIGTRQTEEFFEKSVQKSDLIALLKAVLVEKKVGVDIDNFKNLAKKYSLRLPLQKIHRLLVKYDLPEKKTP